MEVIHTVENANQENQVVFLDWNKVNAKSYNVWKT
jgi:hypothetical protein